MPNCSADGCSMSPEDKVPGLSFFRFPKEKNRREAWVRACRRENFVPSATAVLCSQHFEAAVVDRSSAFSVRLVKTAVPTIFKFPKKTEMPRRCSVPGCKSNYDTQTEHTTTFSFPKDKGLKEKWIAKINNKDIKLGSSAAVCIKHFEERFIIRADKFLQNDGTINVYPREIVKLAEDAYPTKFNCQELLLSKNFSIKWKSSECKDDSSESIEENFMDCSESGSIKRLDDIKEVLNEKLKEPWQHKIQENSIFIYKMEFTEYPKVSISFQILEDLNIKLYYENYNLNVKSVFEHILGADMKLNTWKKLDCVLSFLGTIDAITLCSDPKLTAIQQIINEIILDDTDSIYTEKLTFILNQLTLLLSKNGKYGTDLILWSANLYFQSPEAYSLIRKAEVLTLPTETHLEKLYRDFLDKE